MSIEFDENRLQMQHFPPINISAEWEAKAWTWNYSPCDCTELVYLSGVGIKVQKNTPNSHPIRENKPISHLK